MNSTNISLVLITAPENVAEKLAEQLLEKQLAACVNLLPKVSSIYRWQGKIERAEEVLMIAKTTNSLFSELEKFVLEIHPYDTPEIICLGVEKGLDQYLVWVRSETKGS